MQAQQNDSVKIEIKNLGEKINSAFDDFAPVISADGSLLIFTSRRRVTEKENSKKSSTGSERIYSSEYNAATNTRSAAVLLPEAINIKNRNNSAIALSNDGQHMLIYHDDFDGNGDIYESKLSGTEWSPPKSMGEPINTRYHESSASMSPDGKTIYFVSERPQGEGKRDIWFCTKYEDGTWGKAENIGYPINTDEDEEGVFMHADGKTLYFSSKGHEGLGDYDIFKSEYKNGAWSKPQNLGAPLNTTRDDMFFVMQANGAKGYYSSSVPGGMGDKDIYEVNFSTVKKEVPVEGPKLTLFKGVVLDELTVLPLEASIEIVDNETHTIISTFQSNSSTGKFLISLPAGKNYGIAVKAADYLFYSDNIDMTDVTRYREIEKTISLKKLVVGNKMILKNIFYDFDRATLSSESISELNRMVSLLSENPSLKIEIASHTDSKGSNEYNNKLSQARAQSVVDYLISKGIAQDRLTAKGYGESQAIADNDTEEGRHMNRRTEFKILSK